MVILNVGLRVVAFALAGLLVSPTLWLAVATLLPVAWAGVWATVIAPTSVWPRPPQRESSPPPSSSPERR